jgi:hypothetical protein
VGFGRSAREAKAVGRPAPVVGLRQLLAGLYFMSGNTWMMGFGILLV